MWASKQQLSRRECLDRAHKARSQGKISKAIQLYEQVLARTPGDYEVHARIAPLLVKARRNTDASSNFARAIEGYEEAGFRTKAISVAVLSAEQLPKRLECWMRAAELYREDGRIEDAVDVLVQARLQFAGRRHARSALVVLEELFSIEPSFPVRFDRARTRALLGERREALLELERLLREEPDRLRWIRRAMWQIRRSPGDLFRYLRALLFRR